MHTGDLPRAHAHLARLADGIATGHYAGVYSAFVQLGQGQLARLEGRTEVACACFREVLDTAKATHSPVLAQGALVGLAMMDGMAGTGGTGRELLARALVLDPHIKEFWLLPSLVAAVSERVVANDPARGILIWAMASRLGNRARYHPMYPQDVARITAMLDRARAEHGIPVPDVPADLTAADAIAECREALAALEEVTA